MGHYLNTLYPDSRSVSYSSGMWKQGRKEGAAEPFSLPCSLSLSFPFSTASSSSSTLLVTTSFFSVSSDAARLPPSLFLSSSLLLGFHRVFSLFLIDRWRERESPRESLSGHFHVRWITRSPKSDRLTKCQWGRTIVERISLVANLILRIETNFHGSVTRA